jgi:2'-5' RNA ligase
MGGFQVLGEVDLNESQGKAPSSALDVLGEVDLPEEKPKTYLPEVNKAVASVPKPDSPLNYAVPGNDVTGAVTGFFPSKAPRNGPRGQLPATPPLEAAKAALEATPPQSETPLLPGAATAVTAGEHLATPGQRWQGATEAVQAAGEAATPFMGPAATEMAAAPALAPALKFAAGLGVGIGGQPLAEKGAEKLGASPEQQKFWGELAFWAPQIAGLLASQVKGGVDVTPEGTRAAVSTPGGKVGAGVAVTPEGVTVRGKVGPFEGSKTFARGPQPAGPAVEAPTIEAQPGPPPPSDDPAITSMANAHAADTAAARQAAGIPEPPQPTILDHPDAPPELQQNRISPESIGRMATFVAGLPQAERAQAMQEAHGTLTQALTEMGKKGPIQMPDGTLALVKDPKAAEKIALSIINDAVKEHDKASARTSGDGTRGEKGAVSSQEAAPVEVLGEVPLEPTPSENVSPASKDAQQPALKKGDTAVLAKETKVGDKVLPSGTSVKIQYVHPNGLLVRAVAEDGTKISRGVGAFTKGVESGNAENVPNSRRSVGGEGAPRTQTEQSSSGPGSNLRVPLEQNEPQGATLSGGGAGNDEQLHGDVSGGRPQRNNQPERTEETPAVKTSEPEHPNLNLGEHAAHTEMVPTKTISEYGKDVEMLPVEELEKLATHDRRKEPFGTDMDELKADIQKNGIKEPLELGYNHAEKKAVIWDGNHRLGVAKELGIKELPVRVKTTDFPTAKYGKEVSGFKGEGTVPERLKPSEIGIGAREVKTPSNYPTPESRAASQAAFEKNYPPGTLPEKSLTGDALRAWQQSIGNPLPKEEDPGAKVRAKNPEPTRAEVAAAAEKKTAEKEPKYKFGNTQAPIPAHSDAAQALKAAQDRIPDSDVAGKGKETDPHVTVRYGIKGEDTAGIRNFLSEQAPFEAKLGKTDKFPPSEHSDGAAVIIAPIEASELHRLNAELEKHGEFTEPSFKEYKPHATIAYVDPAKADRYVGMSVTEGKTFTVDKVYITDRDGNAEAVKLEGKGANVTERPPVSANVTKSLASHLLEKISVGEMPKDNPGLKKIVEEFDGKPAEPARMKQAQESLEVAIVQHARAIVDSGGDSRATFDNLVKLYDSQPNLNVRTSTSIENQAYSTPAPLAFLADKLAGVDKSVTVYEPTAGNGMLLVAADPKKAIVNELNADRVAGLKSQGFRPIQGDALKADVDRNSVDAVVTNPPFGSVKDAHGEATKVRVDGYKIGQIDHLIAAKALEAMKAQGKATLILGANKFTAGGQSSDDSIFLNWLYSHYNVSSHFEVEGRLYGRQGAAWPVRVITIDGRQESSAIAPEVGTIQRATTWPEVYEQFNKGMAAQSSRPPRERGANDSLQRPAESEPRAVRTEPRTAPEGIDRQRPESGGASVEQQPGTSPGPVRNSDAERTEGLPVSDPAVRPDADVAESDRLEKGHEAPTEPERTPDAGNLDRSPRTVTSPANEFQVSYSPASGKKDAGVLIPVNMKQPLEQAMNALEDQVGDLDKFVKNELGYKSVRDLHDAFMGLQVDSIAAAIQQMKNGRAVVIADQTGIGKGRQAAGIIRWAAKQGYTPVFVTKAPSLFTDMYGDLSDIGTDDIKPFIVNADEWITLPDGSRAFTNKPGTHRRTLEQIRSTGKLPDDRNAVFLTYSQVNMEGNLQQGVLRALSPNGVFILDESHNAGGDSNTGGYMRDLIGPARGVTYLSATYAKRPDNMPLYYKTDMGEAIGDSGTLVQAMKDGGLPLQTVVSNNLVKAGQMFRRERSYDGVKMVTKVDTAHRKEHARLADGTTEALRAIVDADKAFHSSYVAHAQEQARKENKANKIAGAGNQASKQVQHTEFSSVVHNFVRQMLLGIKADQAADDAIETLKRGEKPLIAVDNTMGSFLHAYVGDHGIRVGDHLEDFDYRTVLSRALDRSRYLSIKDAMGDVHKQYVPLEGLDPKTREAYDDAQKIIDKLKIETPVSPIDWIRHRIEDAGYSVSEITGRNLSVDYSDPEKPKLATVPIQEQRDKVETTRRFNDGRLDAIILNVSGSTGISLHASEKFSDQRPRHMIVVQPAQDINIFMQMLGRIHRTGQVKLPGYTILNADLPAEKRPSALLSKKMKSLNANTSSNTESATSVKAADMLNKYGDQIIGNYLEDNPRLASMLDLDGTDENGDAIPDVARKATGRLAILPVKVQEEFYREVEQQYSDYIAYLDSTNQNELEPKTHDYDAKELRTDTLVEATNPNTPFGESAIYGEYSIKSQGKPLAPAEVTESIKSHLDGKTPEQHLEALSEKLNEELTYYKQTLDPEGAQVGIANTVAHNGRTFLRDHPIGTTMRVDINGDLYSAAITNIRSTHKGTGNPYSLSKFSVMLATNGPMRTIAVPGTQLNKIEASRLYDKPENLFRVARTDTRETAKIITGNLLAAFGELQDTRGTIINFTKQDGTTEQGILLPKRFEFSKNTKGDYRLRDAAHALKFLRKSTNPRIEDIGIASRDGNVRVVNDAGKLAVVTPKAKARGGKYFLDHAITDLTGDFVSQGNTMRASIPKGKETAVLSEIIRKSALYASPSMVEEAKSFAPKEKPESLLMGETGELDIGKLGEVASAFYEQDVAKALEKAGIGLKAVPSLFVRALYPRIEESNPIGRALGVAAPADAVDALMKVQGDRAKALSEFDLVLKGVEKMFDRLPEESRIDFVDRMQTGKKQANSNLDDLAEAFTKVMDAQREQEQEAANMGRAGRQIELSKKANYFHNWWETRPGKEPEEDEGDRISRLFTPRRPLEGTKGYNKRQSYTLKSGIEAGGEPVTTNPVRILRHRIEDGMKFVTARRAWDAAQELGLRQFVRKGAKRPAGFDKIEDKIAKVYFPAESGEGNIQAGEWYVEANTARLLNNMLSVDKIRGNPAGRGLMWLKNASTAVELGLSPFHAVFESIEAMSSMLSLGMQRAYNQGIRQGKPAELAQGIKEMISSPAAPITLAREGAAVPAYIEARARLGKIGLTEYGHVISGEQPHGVLEAVKQFQELRKEKSVQRLIKQYPDLDQLIDDMFQGGLIIGQHRDYQVKALGKTAAEAFSEGNPIGAVWRAIPTITQGVMYPLFNWYIPSLKYSLFLKMMSEAAGEHARELESGELTRATLARKVADSVENRFGELNFDNLFLNRTTKTALQFLFRSMTYKLGTVREFSGAGGGQLRELGTWAKDAVDLLGGGGGGKGGGKDTGKGAFEEEPEPGKTFGEKALPRLDSRAAWVTSLMIVTAMLGTIAAKLLTKKYPWQWIQDDEKEGMSAEAAMLLEVTHPRTGETDSRGKPVRISLPTYWKDVEHAAAHPAQYVLSSLSGIVSKLIDTAENKDYFGNYVYNPTAPISTKLKQAGKYNFPMPFVASNFIRGKAQNESKTAWLSAFGFPKAPSDLDFTPAEKLAQKVIKEHEPPATPEELEQWREKHQAFIDGKLPLSQARGFMKRARESMLQRQMKNSAVSYTDARRIYELANAEEKKTLDHIMREKRARLMREHRGGEVKTAEASN